MTDTSDYPPTDPGHDGLADWERLLLHPPMDAAAARKLVEDLRAAATGPISDLIAALSAISTLIHGGPQLVEDRRAAAAELLATAREAGQGLRRLFADHASWRVAGQCPAHARHECWVQVDPESEGELWRAYDAEQAVAFAASRPYQARILGTAGPADMPCDAATKWLCDQVQRTVERVEAPSTATRPSSTRTGP